MLVLFLSGGVLFEQISLPLQILRVEFENARRRNQRRFRLQKVCAVDCKKGLILFDGVPNLGKSFDDAALILRKNLSQKLLVEVDIANRLHLLGKGVQADRFDLDRGKLRIGKRDARLSGGAHAG